MRYAADGYALPGYFLQDETQLDALALSSSTGSALATGTIDLQSDSFVINTAIADIYGLLALQSNAIAISFSVGGVYLTLDLVGNSEGLSTGSAEPSIVLGRNTIPNVIYLADLNIADSTGTTITLRYSTNKSITTSGNTYTAKIVQPAFMGQSISIDNVIGGAISSSLGELLLTNTKRDLDYLKDYIFEGKTLTIYSYNTSTLVLTTILTQTIEQASFEWDKVSVRLQNKSDLLDKPLQTKKYLGNNVLPDGVEGVSDLLDKYKPLLFGRVANITPTLVNTDKLIFQISSEPVQQVVSVMSNGAYVSVSSNIIATYADFVSDVAGKVPNAGYFTTYSGAEGSFIRVGMESGQLTCTAWEKTSVIYDSPAQVILRILTLAGYTSANYVAADFTAIDALVADNVGIYVTEGQTITEILNQICSSIGVWWGFDATNKFRMYYFGIAASPLLSIHASTPTDPYGITSFDIATASFNNRSIPVKEVKISYDKNWTVQAKNVLAGIIVTNYPDRTTWLGEAYRKVSSVSSSTLALYPESQLLEYETLLNSETAAKSEADRVLALTSVKRRIITLSARMSLADLSSLYICSTISIVLPRYGFTSGTSFILIGMEIDYLNFTANLTLWG